MTPIRKINTSTSQICMGNCLVESYCTSINFSWELGEDNCELLSENAYENRTELVYRTSWSHYTTYVSSIYFFLLLFFFLAEDASHIQSDQSQSIFMFLNATIKHSEVVTRTSCVKKAFLKISQNSQENICARVSYLQSLFYRLGPGTLFKKIFWHRCSCEF